MFEIFSGKKNHFIGIDFGTSSIKVVELSYKQQKVHLENYGVVDLNFAENASQSQGAKALSFEQKLNDALKLVLKKMDLNSGSAYVSLPGFTGLITIIELPDMEEADLANAIQFEAHKYIPSSLDEVVISWEIVERVGGNVPIANAVDGKVPKRIKVLLVAAPKRDAERYSRLVAGTNLEVDAIELETFSIARSLIGEDMGNFFIMDIGARSTNMILVEKGTVIINRNIDAGGSEITTAIADGMGVSRQRAEDFKKGERDILNGKESAIVIPILELIKGESQRILNAYKEKNKDSRIDGIILSGGTSKMKGIEEYFSNILGTKVTQGDPWRRVTVEENIASSVKELGGSFSVALGLALRGIEEYKRK